MHLTWSPSRRPSDNGACRWQQRSARATTSPVDVRYTIRGSSSTRRANNAVLDTSWLQATTYQQFLKNIGYSPRAQDAETVNRLYYPATARRNSAPAGSARLLPGGQVKTHPHLSGMPAALGLAL